MNFPTARWILPAAAALVLAGCAKKASVELVPGAERSRHFDAVNSHLELGGVLYGYADVDGDALALAKTSQSIVDQIASRTVTNSPAARVNLKDIFTDLGLDDVKAVGLSSVHETGGYFRNRAFLYTPDGRHGLLAVFGGEPGRFADTKLAPADTDLYAEQEFDLVAVYDTVKDVISKVKGPEAAAAFERQVKGAGANPSFSLLDLIGGLKGRATVIVRLDSQEVMRIPAPQPVNFPAVTALVRIDGIGPTVQAMLLGKPNGFTQSTEGTLQVFTPSKPSLVAGLSPVIAVDGKALYLATSVQFLHECIARTDGLDSNPAFSSALAALGPEGNGLFWVSPRFFSRLKDMDRINPQANPALKKIFGTYASNLPDATQPMMAVRTNLSDGILMRSTWNRSLKANLAMLMVYNPVTLGLVGALAIPAFQNMRTTSQAIAITGNLRMLAAAADQYYKAHGAQTTTYELLLQDNLIKEVTPVAGEDYHSVAFNQGSPLHIKLPDGRTFMSPRTGSMHRRPVPEEMHTKPSVSQSVPPPADSPAVTPPPQDPQNASPTQALQGTLRASINGNLAILYAAADRYYADHNTTSTTFADLVGPGKPVTEIRSFGGEDYHSLLFKQGHPLRLYMDDGRVFTYPP
jgi:type II secretory pathway pseudopilin PulG